MQVRFQKADAWNLGVRKKFDLITRNGLNIYEKDDHKLSMLYKEFYEGLKLGGVLITSFLTPPPFVDSSSSWNISEIREDDILKQKVMLSIIGAKWTSFRSEQKTRDQLHAAGFKRIECIYDRRRMFPTVVAYKE